MTKAKSPMVAGILVLFSTNTFAAPLSPEIYRSTGAHTVKADHQGNDEFKYEAEPSTRHTSIPTLAEKVIAHAHSKGFRVMEPEIKRDDADLKFRRGHQELDVSIESRNHGHIEYRADLNLNR